MDISKKVNRSSLLTTALSEDLSSSKTSKSTVGKLPMTIYLPDYTEFQIYVAPNTKMGRMIEQILHEHSEQGLYPPLDYKNATKYELRMHEGSSYITFLRISF